MKQWLKHFIESNFGVQLYKGWCPRGMSLEFDRRRLSSAERPLMFDVGANVGDTASEFAKNHPAALIHCQGNVRTALRKYPSICADYDSPVGSGGDIGAR